MACFLFATSVILFVGPISGFGIAVAYADFFFIV
jgi:hypothetical protein